MQWCGEEPDCRKNAEQEEDDEYSYYSSSHGSSSEDQTDDGDRGADAPCEVAKDDHRADDPHKAPKDAHRAADPRIDVKDAHRVVAPREDKKDAQRAAAHRIVVDKKDDTHPSHLWDHRVAGGDEQEEHRGADPRATVVKKERGDMTAVAHRRPEDVTRCCICCGVSESVPILAHRAGTRRCRTETQQPMWHRPGGAAIQQQGGAQASMCGRVAARPQKNAKPESE